MDVGIVAQLWRYPFKSMGGEQHDALPMTERGVAGDRSWAVRDEVNGGIRGARKLPGLLRCAARFTREPAHDGDSGEVEVTLPGGERVLAGDPAAAGLLSAALGHPVTVWPLQPAEDLDHYRQGRPTFDDLEQQLRLDHALEDDEPLPAFDRLPRDLVKRTLRFATPPGSYLDAFPILVLTSASLDHLRGLLPDSVVDVRRFRPNIVVETPPGMTGPVERSWEGRRLHVGEVELALTWRCPRCAVVTHGFDDLPKDPAIMRTLVRELTHDFGIYADVRSPGRISVGDPVVLSDPRD